LIEQALVDVEKAQSTAVSPNRVVIEYPPRPSLTTAAGSGLTSKCRHPLEFAVERARSPPNPSIIQASNAPYLYSFTLNSAQNGQILFSFTLNAQGDEARS
jgi:hypothetical protein